MQQGNALPPETDHAPSQPLVLSSMVQSGAQITAANAAAIRLGLFTGMPVADARAIHPPLLVEPADPKGDEEALRRLALWCQRYSPLTRADPPDGICIDIAGCAHLFGGEAAMAEDLSVRLQGFGLTARIAIAPTIGAARAIAHRGPQQVTFVPDGQIREHIAPLPIDALRLNEATVTGLAKLGLSSIALLIGKPRTALALRFGAQVMHRLDQALGLENEVFNPVFPPPFFHSACRFAEPVTSMPFIAKAVHHLTGELAQTLFHAGKGVRRIRLALYRVDGWQEMLEIRLSRLSQDADHLARLLCERLDQIRDHAGFGFEAATLAAYGAEDFQMEQAAMMSGTVSRDHDLARLHDRLVNRFGERNVTRFLPRASYLPERAVRAMPVIETTGKNSRDAHPQDMQRQKSFTRPPLLLDPPEPVNVMVEMPDKPPARFEWRRISHRVRRADGPERIAPEWWVIGDPQRKTRDYYRVEDEAGRRFWLYRDGLYDRAGDDPRWFIHGVFA